MRKYKRHELPFERLESVVRVNRRGEHCAFLVHSPFHPSVYTCFYPVHKESPFVLFCLTSVSLVVSNEVHVLIPGSWKWSHYRQKSQPICFENLEIKEHPELSRWVKVITRAKYRPFFGCGQRDSTGEKWDKGDTGGLIQLSGSRRKTESSTLPSLEIEFYLFLKSSSQSR